LGATLGSLGTATTEGGALSLQDPANKIAANVSMARGFIKDMSDFIVTSQDRIMDDTLLSAVRGLRDAE
jgi:hypothetical protein